MARMPNYFYGGTGAAGQLNPGPWAAAMSSLGQALFGDQKELDRRDQAASENLLRNAQIDKINLENEQSRAVAEQEASLMKLFETRGQPEADATMPPMMPAPQTQIAAGPSVTPAALDLSAPQAPPTDEYVFDGSIPAAPDLARNDISLPPDQPLSEIPLDAPPDPGVQSLQQTMTPEPPAKVTKITDEKSLVASLTDLEVMQVAMAPPGKKRQALQDVVTARIKAEGDAAATAAEGGKTIEERDQAVLIGGDPNSPEYAMAYFRTFQQPTYRERVWVDEEGEHKELVPVYLPVPKGVRPPGSGVATVDQQGGVQQDVAQAQDMPPVPPSGDGVAPSSGGGGGVDLGNKKPQLAGEVAPRAGALAAAQTDADTLRSLIFKPDGTIDRSVLWSSSPEFDVPFTNIKIRGVGKGAQARSAVDAMTDAIIRPLTGAAVNVQEFPRYQTIFVPQATDSDALIVQKLQRYDMWSAAIQQAQASKMVPTAEWLAAKRDEILAQYPDPVEQPQAPAAPAASGGVKNWVRDENGQLVPQ